MILIWFYPIFAPCSLLELVENIGKSYVVWQEILDNGLKIKKDTVVDVWKGGWQEEMDKVTAAGYDVILSAPWYLNYISYGSDWVTVSVSINFAYLLIIVF